MKEEKKGGKSGGMGKVRLKCSKNILIFALD